MKKTFRLLSLCMIAMLVISFGGCQTSSTSKTEENNSTSSDGSVDLKGRTITVAVMTQYYVPQEDDSSITDENQKQLNKVKLEREKEAERKYNCNIEWKVITNDEGKQLLPDMKAGKYYADIVAISPYFGELDMLKENLIAPLDQYIDYKSGVYSTIDQSINLWKSKHYGIAVCPQIPEEHFTYNKTMISGKGLPDPYELMQKGQWTWDAFLDAAKKTTMDTNGDGVIDCWGVDATYYYIYRSFMYSNNGDYIIDDNGEYKLVLDSDEVKESIDFVNKLYNTYNVVYNDLSSSRNEHLFSSNNAAFTFGPVQNADFELGRVCVPKGPKASGYNSVITSGIFYAVPSNVEDIKSVAGIMSDLFSYNDITKEDYYDVSKDMRKQYPDDLFNIFTKNSKYSLFISDADYNNHLYKIYTNIIKNKMSADDAINAERDEINKSLDTLNQQYQ